MSSKHFIRNSVLSTQILQLFDIEEVNKLEQENKELKETIKQYCQWLDEEREENDKLQKVYQNDHCDLLNYRSALEEIREILLEHSCSDSHTTKYIINKINEVIG